MIQKSNLFHVFFLLYGLQVKYTNTFNGENIEDPTY